MKHSNRQRLIIISILLLCVGVGCVTTRSQRNVTAYSPSNITVTRMTPKLKEKTISLVGSLYIDVEKRSEMLERLESPHPANLKAVIESLVKIVTEDDYNQIRLNEILKSYLDYDIDDTDPPDQETRKDVLTAAVIRVLATDTLIEMGESITIKRVGDKFKLSKYIDGWVRDLASEDVLTVSEAKKDLVYFFNESIYVIIDNTIYKYHQRIFELGKRSLFLAENIAVWPSAGLSYMNKTRIINMEMESILRNELKEKAIPFLISKIFDKKTSDKERVIFLRILDDIEEDINMEYLKSGV